MDWDWIRFALLVSTKYGQMSLEDRIGKDFLNIAFEISNKRTRKRKKCPICKTQPYTYDSVSQTCLYCEGVTPYKKRRKKK